MKENSAKNLFETAVDNNGKKMFDTKRQASKYLNGYGRTYKLKNNIPLSEPKRRLHKHYQPDNLTQKERE